MALAPAELRRRVDVDEPDYPLLAGTLGEDEVPALVELARGGEPAVATKATYLLGMLPGAAALEGLTAAARSDNVLVRLAAAAGLGDRTRAPGAPAADDGAAEVLRGLMADADAGVRKVAVRSARNLRRHELRGALERIATGDPEPHLRRAAREALGELG